MIVDFIPSEYKDINVFKELSDSAELREYIEVNGLEEEQINFLIQKIFVFKLKDNKLKFKFDKVIENEMSVYFFEVVQKSEEDVGIIFDSVYYCQRNGRAFKINLPVGFLSGLSKNIDTDLFLGLK